MKFILCRRCFTVRNPEVTCAKNCENGTGKNPQDIATSLGDSVCSSGKETQRFHFFVIEKGDGIQKQVKIGEY
jgi:hypothetical protein